MRLSSIIFCTIFLAGCSQEHYFVKEGITEEQLLKDHYECLLEIGNISQDNHKFFMEMEKLCMRTKGYQVYESQPEGAQVINNEGA